MLLVDNSKAVLVGQINIVVEEVAFLIDKLCADTDRSRDGDYKDIQDRIIQRVQLFKKEREGGFERSHPHEDSEDSDNLDKDNLKKKASAAEEALIEAMKEIQLMKAEKAKKAAKKKKKKKDI